MYPEWLSGVRRNPTLPRQPDSENPSPSVKESQPHRGGSGGPYTFDGVAPLTAAATPSMLRSEAQPGLPEVVVAGSDDSVEEVIVSVDSMDPRLSKVVHFPDPTRKLDQ